MTKYRSLAPMLGCRLEEVVNTLLEHKAEDEYVSIKFNDMTLYSDTVTMDDAYLKVTNMTKAEFDKLYSEELGRINKQIGMSKYELAGISKEEEMAIERALNGLQLSILDLNREYAKDHLIRVVVNGKSQSLKDMLNRK